MTKIAEGAGIRELILANGLLGSNQADIYTVPELRQAESISVVFHNTAASSNIMYVFLQPSGGTSRRILKQALGAGETLILSALVMNGGDKIRGYATNAGEVSFTISRAEEYTT